MNILVLGVVFEISRPISSLASQSVIAQKKAYEALLERIVAERKIQLIGEGDLEGQPTIAKALSERLKVRHIYLEMSPMERVFAGIEEDQQSRKGNVPVKTDAERRAHVVAEVLDEAKGATSILVIVGCPHLDAIVDLLTRAGHRAERHDIKKHSDIWKDLPP